MELRLVTAHYSTMIPPITSTRRNCIDPLWVCCLYIVAICTTLFQPILLSSQTRMEATNQKFSATLRIDEDDNLSFSTSKQDLKGKTHCLVAEVLMDSVPVGPFIRVIKSLWKKARKGFTILPLSTTRFLFTFKSHEERNLVFEEGTWRFGNILIVLRRTDKADDYNSLSMTMQEFWVQVSGLHPSLQTCTYAGILASGIGKTIFIDMDKDSVPSYSFMRIRVLVDIAKPIKRFAKLIIQDNQAFDLDLSYENLPRICHFCGLFNHSSSKCNSPEFLNKEEPLFGSWLSAEPLYSTVTERKNFYNSLKKKPFRSHLPSSMNKNMHRNFSSYASNPTTGSALVIRDETQPSHNVPHPIPVGKGKQIIPYTKSDSNKQKPPPASSSMQAPTSKGDKFPGLRPGFLSSSVKFPSDFQPSDTMVQFGSFTAHSAHLKSVPAQLGLSLQREDKSSKSATATTMTPLSSVKPIADALVLESSINTSQGSHAAVVSQIQQ